MRWGLFVGVLVVMLLSGAGAMAKQADGFAGTAFGSRLASLPSFMKLKTVGDVAYAVNLSESYRIDGRAPVVFYGFVGGKLFAAYVRLDGIVGRDAMARQLTAKFGKPAIVTEGGVEVLRWRKGDLKVKLKFDQASGSLKLAYYSISNGGAAARTLAEPDSVDLDELSRIYEKNKISKGISIPSAPSPKGYSPYDDGVSAPVGRFPGQ